MRTLNHTHGPGISSYSDSDLQTISRLTTTWNLDGVFWMVVKLLRLAFLDLSGEGTEGQGPSQTAPWLQQSMPADCALADASSSCRSVQSHGNFVQKNGHFQQAYCTAMIRVGGGGRNNEGVFFKNEAEPRGKRMKGKMLWTQSSFAGSDFKWSSGQEWEGEHKVNNMNVIFY